MGVRSMVVPKIFLTFSVKTKQMTLVGTFGFYFIILKCLVFDPLFDFDDKDRGAVRPRSFVFLANFSEMADLSGPKICIFCNKKGGVIFKGAVPLR